RIRAFSAMVERVVDGVDDDRHDRGSASQRRLQLFAEHLPGPAGDRALVEKLRRPTLPPWVRFEGGLLLVGAAGAESTGEQRGPRHRGDAGNGGEGGPSAGRAPAGERV